jgi:ABC-2 type transport system permease protein
LWFLPWTAAARIASGAASPVAWTVIAVWIAAVYLFGRRQFDRSLREVELSRPQLENAGAGRAFGWLLSWPSSVFPDPLGALAEKELRVLARAPRFRLAFIMGFSFGLMIWTPMAFQHGRDSWIRQNFLAVAMMYAVLLLADVLYWNIFGLDRTAAQSYFVYPARVRSVILAKNVATGFFTAIDAGIVLVVCLIIRIPMRPLQAAEAVVICTLIAVWLLAVGNLVSVWNPRAADMSQAFRRTSGVKVQWAGLLGFLVAGVPVSLAYVARFALDTELAFFGTLGFMLLIGAYVWWLSVETAERILTERRESTLAALSRLSTPISG